MAFTGFALTIVHAGAGADPGNRQRSQRLPRLVRGRGTLHAALRAGEDRVRHLGRAPAGRPPHGARVAARDADSAGARRRHRAGADRGSARPRPDGVAGHHPAWPAVVRGPAAAGVRQLAAGGRRRRRPCWRCPRATAPTGSGPGWTPAPTPRAPATRPARPSSRWPTAACSATGSGRARPSGTICPTPHNDFIFAIIGEELGFVGAVGLLCLFGLFAYTGMRIARRSADPFLRLLTATATLWVVGPGRSSTSATWSACCRSPAFSCR